jgi:hypothetical protein
VLSNSEWGEHLEGARELEVLHHHEGRARLGASDVVDAHDVLAPDLRRETGFADEALDGRRSCLPLGPQALDRDALVEADAVLATKTSLARSFVSSHVASTRVAACDVRCDDVEAR